MDILAALYQQFDPAHALEADEADLYVDWQREIDADDVKQRLANSIANSGPIPVCRLFTGHKGVGKTTELNRVKQRLEKRGFFVSMLRAERWVDLQDVAAPDIAFQMVLQLVEDLADSGFTLARTKFGEFFKEFRDVLSAEVELKDLKLGAGPFELAVALKKVPGARATLRRLLEGRLPSIYDLVNKEILSEARTQLGKKHILLIVDELDRIPQKVLNSQGLTNHENLFLDHAGVLRSLNCDVLYTIPIEIAYSPCRNRLEQAYSACILDLPVIPVATRGGGENRPGLDALVRIAASRTKKAGAALDGFFESRELLERLGRLSGGHVRSLFLLLRSAIERTEHLPLTAEVVERTIRRQASDLALPLRAKHWDILRQVHECKTLPDEDLSFGLLRDLYIFSYQDDQGSVWYDWHPLLAEVKP